MGEDMKTGPKVFLIISTLVFGFAFGIGAVVIGSRYENDAGSLNGCGLTSLPPLPTWLIVYGSTQIVFAIILTGALLIFNSAKQVFVVVSALCGCFNLAWNIVGGLFQSFVFLFSSQQNNPFCSCCPVS
jgi:hypothetical protein